MILDFFNASDFTALPLKFACMTSFVLLLGQLRDFHSKNDWTHLWNFKFYDHLLVKDQ